MFNKDNITAAQMGHLEMGLLRYLITTLANHQGGERTGRCRSSLTTWSYVHEGMYLIAAHANGAGHAVEGDMRAARVTTLARRLGRCRRYVDGVALARKSNNLYCFL